MRTTINLNDELLEAISRIAGVNRADRFDLRGTSDPDRTRESLAPGPTRRQRGAVAGGTPAASFKRCCVLMLSSEVLR